MHIGFWKLFKNVIGIPFCVLIYEEPWLILIDLPPEKTLASWYGLRAWIECGFKHIKSAGWQWQYTRMIDPERASRFWLAIAVATLWVLSVGGQADATLPASSLQSLPQKHIPAGSVLTL